MLIEYIHIMNVNYDPNIGIPTFNMQNASNFSIIPYFSLFILVIIIVSFVILFAGLNNNSDSSSMDFNSAPTPNTTSSKLLGTILLGTVSALILIIGAKQIFNFNITATLKDLFTMKPEIDINVTETDALGGDSPIPEIMTEKQVFHVPGNEYNYENAKAICKAYGSRLATYDEVESAYQDGAEWCSYGWSDNQMALFPTQTKTWDHLQTVEGHEHDCGRPGINGGYIANDKVRFGVNCYGNKPKITQAEKNLMNSTPVYPVTMKDIEEEKRVDYWRRNISDILISPFNNKVWSLV